MNAAHATPPRQQMRGNLLLLGWLSLLTDMSSQMITPLMPFFLTISLGATPWIVGMIDGAAESMAALLKLYAGRASDRLRRRKPWIAAGYGLSAVSKLLFVPATSWLFVLGARLLERVGKGLRGAPRDALIVDSVPEQVRGRAFGFQRGMDALGGVLGALLALALIQVMSIRDVFVLALLPAFAALLLIWRLREADPETSEDSIRTPKADSKQPLSSPLRLALACVALGTLGRLGFAFLLLHAFGQNGSLSQTVLWFVGYQAIYALMASPIGRLSDRVGRAPVLILGALLFAASFLLIPLDHGIALVLSVLCYAVAEAALDTSQRAWVADLAPSAARGSAMGAYHATIALLALPAGVILGGLWMLDPAIAATSAAVLTLLQAGLVAWVIRQRFGETRSG